MLKKKMPAFLRMGIFIVVLLAATTMLTGTNALAQKKGPHGVFRHRPPEYGRVVGRLPAGHKPVVVRGSRYYHYHGAFYRKAPSGFVLVRAPLGAVVVSLPVGFVRLVIGGAPYFWYEGVYYREVPSGYEVVEPPLQVEQEIPASEQVSVTANLLNVRSGPGMNYPVIMRIYRGTVLAVRGHAPGWFYVELPTGRFGWVMSGYTAPVGTVSPPANG